VCDDLVEGSIDAARLEARGFSLKPSNCYVINIIQCETEMLKHSCMAPTNKCAKSAVNGKYVVDATQ